MDALVADLAAEDARVREQAIRVLAEQRARAAVPALIERLRLEEPRLGHRIVAALAQIGDERAVPALIELSRGSDPALTTRLVRFIGDIGGAEAEGVPPHARVGAPRAAGAEGGARGARRHGRAREGGAGRGPQVIARGPHLAARRFPLRCRAP